MNTFYTQLSEILCGSTFPDLGNSLIKMMMIQLICLVCKSLTCQSQDPNEFKTTEHVQSSSALFFQYNTQLGPPFHILVDTNFINFSIKNKMDIIQNMMDTLYAKCIPYITDCVMAELEKLGSKHRIALRMVKDPRSLFDVIFATITFVFHRFERLPCMHKGTYADDCLVSRVTQHKAFIVATCDKDLKRRIRKVIRHLAPGKLRY